MILTATSQVMLFPGSVFQLAGRKPAPDLYLSGPSPISQRE
jgi:hypothetical protein